MAFNSDRSPQEAALSSAQAVMLGVELPAIIFTNILSLLTFKRMNELQLQHYLLMSLALSDLVMVIPLMVTIIGLVNEPLLQNVCLCKVIAITNHSIAALNTWIRCGVCIDKWLSIFKAVKHKQFVSKHRPHHVAICYTLAAAFLVVGIIVTSTLVGGIKAAPNKVFATCLYTIDIPYILLIGTLFYLLPHITILVTHLSILFEMRKSRFRKRTRIKKAMTALLFIVGIYYLCWLPYSVVVLWRACFPQSAVPETVEFVSMKLLIANTSMNFFVYLICFKGFRNELKGLLHVQTRIQPQ